MAPRTSGLAAGTTHGDQRQAVDAAPRGRPRAALQRSRADDHRQAAAVERIAARSAGCRSASARRACAGTIRTPSPARRPQRRRRAAPRRNDAAAARRRSDHHADAGPMCRAPQLEARRRERDQCRQTTSAVKKKSSGDANASSEGPCGRGATPAENSARPALRSRNPRERARRDQHQRQSAASAPSRPDGDRARRRQSSSGPREQQERPAAPDRAPAASSRCANRAGARCADRLAGTIDRRERLVGRRADHERVGPGIGAPSNCSRSGDRARCWFRARTPSGGVHASSVARQLRLGDDRADVPRRVAPDRPPAARDQLQTLAALREEQQPRGRSAGVGHSSDGPTQATG